MRKTEPVEEELLKLGTQVEVASNEKGFRNSWYKGRISHPPDSTKKTPLPRRRRNHFWVEYEEFVEEEDQSKHLKEYVERSFIRPLPPTSSACTIDFEKKDIVEADYRDGRWVGVVKEVLDNGFRFLVAFASPYEEIVFRRDQLRAGLVWIGAKNWVRFPKKNAFRFPQDGDETFGALQLKSIIAEVSAMERTPSPAKRLKQSPSADAERRQSLVRKNVVQALTALPLFQSCKLSPSEGNAKSKRKMEFSGADSCRRMILNPNNIQGNSKTNDGTSYKKRRRGPTKKDVQRFLELIKHGEEPRESGYMHESVIEQIPTSNAAGTHCRSRTKEVQVTEIVDGGNGVEEVVDEQGGRQNNALVLYSNPALTKCSKSHPATLSVDSQPDKRQSWPFTKRSEMWKVFESMEVFKKIPQMPHFAPLNELEEHSREMSAISMMMRFTYEVERITTGFADGLQSTRIIHDSLDNLKELESHGFSTIPLQVYLNELLENEERENELQGNLKVIETHIRMCQGEISEAERMLNESVDELRRLQGQMRQSEAVKNHKEAQVAQFESAKGIISRELNDLRLMKKKPPLEW